MKRLASPKNDNHFDSWPFPSETPVKLKEHFTTVLPDGQFLYRKRSATLAAMAIDPKESSKVRTLAAELIEMRGGVPEQLRV
jgi:hypothetical protein